MIALALSIIALIVALIALVKVLKKPVTVNRVNNIVDANGTIRMTILVDGTVVTP